MTRNPNIIPFPERRAHPEMWTDGCAEHGANASLDGDNVGGESEGRPLRVSAIALSAFALIGLTIIATVFLINLALETLRGG